MNDDVFSVYQGGVEDIVGKDTIYGMVDDLQGSDEPRAASRFARDPATGAWGPVAFAGYTVITPPFCEDRNSIVPVLHAKLRTTCRACARRR